MFFRYSSNDSDELVGLRGCVKSVNVFTTSGNYTLPNNCTGIIIEAWAGGGAGGGGAGGTSNTSGGGGGASGGYSYGIYHLPPDVLATIGNTTLTITVGAGGAGVSAAAGNAGGNTYVFIVNPTGNTYLANVGGGAGGSTLTTGTSVNSVAGGAGVGGITNQDNIVNTGISIAIFSAGHGGRMNRFSGAIGWAGEGADAPRGGSGGRGSAVNTNGNPGTVPGGGGGGALVINSATARTGGAGANGMVIIWELY